MGENAVKYSEAQVKSIANKRWFKKNRTRIIIQLGLCVLWAVVVKVIRPDSNAWIYIAPFALVIGAGTFSYYGAIKRFVERVRKNPEILE